MAALFTEERALAFGVVRLFLKESCRQHLPTHRLQARTLESSNTRSQQCATGEVTEVINFARKLQGSTLLWQVPQKTSKAEGETSPVCSGVFLPLSSYKEGVGMVAAFGVSARASCRSVARCVPGSVAAARPRCHCR